MADGGTFEDTERNQSSDEHSLPGESREGLVRTQKERESARRTHILETAEGGTCQDTEINRQREAHSHSGGGRGRGGTCQDMERNRPSEAHPPPGYSRGRDLSGHIKKPTKRGALTSWRRQREGLVRTHKETGQARCTHILEREGLVRIQKETKQGSLTSWRWQRKGLVRT